jgi:hypothetical protein
MRRLASTGESFGVSLSSAPQGSVPASRSIPGWHNQLFGDVTARFDSRCPRTRACSPMIHGASAQTSWSASSGSGAKRTDGSSGFVPTEPSATNCAMSSTRVEAFAARRACATTVCVVPRSMPTTCSGDGNAADLAAPESLRNRPVVSRGVPRDLPEGSVSPFHARSADDDTEPRI